MARAPVRKPVTAKKGVGIGKISLSTLAKSRQKIAPAQQASPFTVPKAPPGCVPSDKTLAMDSNVAAFGTWAGSYYGYAFTEGIQFLGYPYLAELAQRPEYRRIIEVIATEMTRKWIRLHATGDDDKTDKIARINDGMDRLQVRDVFKKCAEQDGFFGRGHLYIDTGATDDRDELQKPIGNGRDKLSKAKVGKGQLKALRAVEAVWTYPTNYNSNDPLKGDWYKPEMWFVMGKQIHASRLLTFIGREVPDLLKPSYSFGGLALTQMAKPYVDNWLETRQAVNDAISAYSVFVLSTSMAQQLQVGGEELFTRIDLFNNLRNNRGAMAVDKETEDLKNVASPLGTLDLLQAQAQEHICTPVGMPLVKYTGITPSGLNASSEGEIRVWYDWVAAYQESFFRPNLTKVIDFIQLSEFGEVDQDITFQFEPLWALSEKELAEVDKTEAETAQIRIDSGVVSPLEERQRLVKQPDSPYDGLNPDEAPDLFQEEEAGLEPVGGRPEVQEVEAEKVEGVNKAA